MRWISSLSEKPRTSSSEDTGDPDQPDGRDEGPLDRCLFSRLRVWCLRESCIRENRPCSLSGGRRPARKRASSDPTPSKCPNNGGRLPEEGTEGRQPTKENIGQATAPRTQSRIGELSDLLGVRQAARKDKRARFTALLHHVTVNLLRDSFYALKRGAAPGVDGVWWQEYETDLDEKLADLHGRIHRGTYRAQPSKRTYIPKADGRQRPLGIAALEDKIVQQAVVT